MNSIHAIRKQLGVTQAELARGIGVTQSNVSFYERGQTVPPNVAGRLIDYAKTLGTELTFDQIYRPEPSDPAPADEARAA